MYSVLQVFYKDLWLPNACRRVKWLGCSSASRSSEGAHVGKQGVREAEVLHFRAKGKLDRSPGPYKGHQSWVWWQDPFGFSQTIW